MKKYESGYTLIGVLAIFTIASILAISLVTLSMNTLKASKIEVDNQSVFYIAEAGLNKAVNELEKEASEIALDVNSEEEFINTLKESLNKVGKSSEKITFSNINSTIQPRVKKLEIDDKADGIYHVSSTGEIGEQERQVEQEISIKWNAESNNTGQPSTWGDFEDFGVYTFGEMILNGGRYAKDIGTASTQKGSLNLENNVEINESNNIFVPNGDKDIVNNSSGNPNLEPESKEPLQRPPMPEFIDTNEGTWETYESCPPPFTLGNEVKNIILKNRTTFAGCGINAGGHGGDNAELNIFIDSSIEIPTHTQILTAPGIPINLYVNGDVIVPSGSSGSIIMAAIYAQGDIRVEDSAGAQFYGSLFSEGNISFEKGSSQGLIYGEVIYAKQNVAFEGNGNKLHGTSVVGSNVKLDNTTIEANPDPNRVKSGSLSLNELNKLPPDQEESDNEVNEENKVPQLDFKPGSLHEISK